MKVTTIGTGTGAPSATRVSSSHLVEVDDLRILLDCGSGSVHRMAGLGIDWQQITHLFVTHFHADHTSDIPTLVYAWRYGTLTPRTAPALIFGPPGLVQRFDNHDAAFAGKMRTLGFPLHITELEPGSRIDLSASVHVESHKVTHSDESVAYCISRGERRIVYTGDCAFDPAFAEWARGCDLLLMECSLPEQLAVPTHMTPEQCGRVAEIAKPRAVALTHLYPPLDAVDVKSIVASRYDGDVHVAYDGWTFEIED
jgi:ribonuclease BN (tRNA processing enzyme)